MKSATILDPIASIIICLFIEKATWDIFKDSIDKMVDKSCPDDMIEEMKHVILSNEEPIEIDEIKTRLFGNKIYVDMEIKMNPEKL